MPHPTPAPQTSGAYQILFSDPVIKSGLAAKMWCLGAGCRQAQQLKQNKDLMLSRSTLAPKLLCVATLCVAMQFRKIYVALQHGGGTHLGWKLR
jgi:hypothetical protein